MYRSARQKPWECTGGFVDIEVDRSYSSLLDTLEDKFVAHRKSPSGIEIRIDSPEPSVVYETVQRVKQLARTHKIVVVNYGLSEDGVVINFRKPEDVVIFRLFWEPDGAD